MKERVKTAISSLFTFDIRALGLMRIGVSIALLTDLLIRWTDLEAHYSHRGVLPPDALFIYSWHNFSYSIYTMCSSVNLLAILFFVNMVCILILMAGYKTRIFTFLCWFFLLSLHNRNPFIHQGGDDLLRLILFWGMFLPWGYCYSIDALQIGKLKKQGYSFTSYAGFAYMLQVAYVYFFSALLKSGSEWTSEFTALYYALSLDMITLPVGKLIYPYEGLLKVLTFLTFLLELLLPFILLIPFRVPFLRMVFFLIMASFHVGIVLTMNVGLFPLISVVVMIGLLPTWAMDRLSQSFLLRKIPGFFNKIRTDLAMPRYFYFPREGYYQKVMAVLIIIYTISWNLETGGRPGLGVMASGSDWLGLSLRIDQHWGMFAPAVFKDDGWFIFSAKTEKNKEIDLNREGMEVNYDKPELIAAQHKNDRWRKYSENILLIDYSYLRPYYCNYLMKKWNNAHPEEKVTKVEIIYMKEVSLPDYKAEKPKRELLCDCLLQQ